MISAEQVDTNRAVDSAPFTEGSEVRYCPNCGEPMIGAPVLQCGDCGAEHRARCYVRRISANCYRAECIDLDISAEAATREGAIGGLQDAMMGYLKVVLDSQETNTDMDFLRPSPLGHRVRYYVERIKDMMSARFLRHPHGRNKRKRTFDKNLNCCSHC